MGKWHLGFFDQRFTPDQRGFDTFDGYYSGQEDYFNHSTGGFFDFRANEEIAFDVNGTYGTFLLADLAEDVIRTHDPAEGPLFLQIANQVPHVPNVAERRERREEKEEKGDREKRERRERREREEREEREKRARERRERERERKERESKRERVGPANKP